MYISRTVEDNVDLNPSLLWEMIKHNVRSASVRFAIENEKTQKMTELKLCRDIEIRRRL